MRRSGTPRQRTTRGCEERRFQVAETTDGFTLRTDSLPPHWLTVLRRERSVAADRRHRALRLGRLPGRPLRPGLGNGLQPLDLSLQKAGYLLPREVHFPQLHPQAASYGSAGRPAQHAQVEDLVFQRLDLAFDLRDGGGSQVLLPLGVPSRILHEGGGVRNSFQGGSASGLAAVASPPSADLEAGPGLASAKLVGDLPAGGVQQPGLERASRRISLLDNGALIHRDTRTANRTL